MPALRAHFQIAASKTGLIASCFPLGMFVAVFVFPILSDIVGRKPILVVSYLGVGIGFLLQALAVHTGASFKTFLLLRVLSGAFAGASTVVKAYIADISSSEMLPQNMAWRESAATLAFILGPTIGGLLLAYNSLYAVIMVEGMTSVLAGLLIAFTLGSPSRKTSSVDWQAVKNKDAENANMTCPIAWGAPWVPIITMMVISCAYNFGASFFDGYFAVLGAERFGLSAPAIGSVQTFMAIVVFSGTAGLYGPVVRRLGLVETAVMGLLLIAAGLVSIGLPRTVPGLFFGVLLYAAGVPFFSPSVPTLLTRCAPDKRRGTVLGVDSAVNSVGRILAPTVLGGAYERSPERAFGLVGLVVAVGAAVMAVEKQGLNFSASWRTQRNSSD